MFLSGMTEADTFCVTNETELQAALDDPADNTEDDVVQIKQGTYVGSFIYAPTEPEPGGSYGLTIEGGYTPGCGSRKGKFFALDRGLLMGDP